MKNITVIILILLLFVVLGLYLVCFQVRENESVLITRFGEPVRQIPDPGLQFMWPPPIEKKINFDTRLRLFEADLGETTTQDASPIIVKTYIVWKIANPLNFFNSVGSVKEAEVKLLSQLSDTQNKVVGLHKFSEFVNSDPSRIKLGQIQNEMLADLSSSVKDIYGIEIKTLGIKQLKISEDVSRNVFERMRAERDGKTKITIAEGNAEAKKIKADADLKRDEVLAAADARAKAIMGKGDAEAAKYYKMLEQDASFAIFLREIDALRKILKERSTVILSSDTQPFKLLKEMPQLTPAEPEKSKK